MRGSESEESEHESSSPLSQPLFEGNWASALEEEPGTMVRKPLEKVGPRSRWPWPTCGVGRPQGGPLGAPLWPGDSSTVINFENMVHGQKFARKDVQIIFFQRILKLRKYFWSFCKKGKMLEKFQHAENNFENFQICSGEKTNEVQRKF